MNWISELLTSLSLDCKDRRQNSAGGHDSSIEQVDRSLRAAKPTSENPSNLHSAVMSRLRSSAQTRQPQTGMLHGLMPRTVVIAATSILVLACAGIWIQISRSPRHHGTNSIQSASTFSSDVLAPLSNELDSLNKDLEKATSFLLASVPTIEN